MIDYRKILLEVLDHFEFMEGTHYYPYPRKDGTYDATMFSTPLGNLSQEETDALFEVVKEHNAGCGVAETLKK